jgi:hypothetical protein
MRVHVGLLQSDAQHLDMVTMHATDNHTHGRHLECTTANTGMRCWMQLCERGTAVTFAQEAAVTAAGPLMPMPEEAASVTILG